MAFLRQIFDTLTHLSPAAMNGLAHSLGSWLHVVLFAIVFAETGLVAVPFLPGDSLLFTVGAVAAYPDSPISLPLTAALLIAAAVVGDAVNYAIGYRLGPRVFASEGSRLLNRKHLDEAQKFYDRHGGKTIIFARFVPIVRTFAPFVAGVGRMSYPKFAAYNIGGGIAWVLIFLLAGWGFGTIPTVQRNFQLVILAVIVLSILPALYHLVREQVVARRGRSALLTATTLESTDLSNDPPR